MYVDCSREVRVDLVLVDLDRGRVGAVVAHSVPAWQSLRQFAVYKT